MINKKGKELPLLERTINNIYCQGQETYLIPIYQRNYAWQEDEIRALIKDVYDSMKKSDKSVYYIGTLVTYNRGDNIYEVIDGQQRLTTIYLILKALKVDISNKLTYSARKRSVLTIRHLDNNPNLGDDVDNGIRDGYKYATKALDDIVGNDEREKFKQFFLNNVDIIHYSVPKDVDLNHYFEVMNSRGEQLEKHEIVKSMLGEYLDKTDIATFGKVWEACSEMNAYIQQTFSGKEVFGDHLNEFVINDFSQIPACDESEGKETIINLLSNPIEQQYSSNAYEQSDKFQPIIDFPNFLLIVLKVTMMDQEGFDPSEFVLDDKQLLDEFDNSLDGAADKVNFAKQFAFNLLKAKFFLDNFIVHHALDNKETVGDNPWKLQCLYKENSKKQYLKNLSEDADIQKDLVHLLSMFEVTFTPKQRKNYLFYCMAYLFKNGMPSDRDYLRFLRQLSDKYFYNVYLNQECLNERNQPLPNAFDNVVLKNGSLNLDQIGVDGVDYRSRFNEIYKQGQMDIPLYVFNYTDYQLWKKYSDELRGNKTKKGSRERSQFFESLGCSDFELDPFNNFYFSRTRKSLEHFYPQEKAGVGKPLSSEAINCFGNFAMIGADANSSGSNWSPKAKLDHYSDEKADQVSVASLKFKIMMQMCQDNYALMLDNKLSREPGLEWNDDDMQLHQRKMLEIIIKGNNENWRN